MPAGGRRSHKSTTPAGVNRARFSASLLTAGRRGMWHGEISTFTAFTAFTAFAAFAAFAVFVVFAAFIAFYRTWRIFNAICSRSVIFPPD